MKDLVYIFLVVSTLTVKESLTQKPQLGRGVNILSRHGLMNNTIKHSNANDITGWIFRDRQFSIFKNAKAAPTKYNNFKTSSGFDGEFQIDFCRTYDELMEAFYKDFDVEGFFRPYAPIIDTCEDHGLEETFGIPSSLLRFGHGYVFLRFSRFHENKHLFGTYYSVAIDDEFSNGIKMITASDAQTVKDFIQKHGTHYISSYVSGNSVYQIFVYKRKTYLDIIKRLKGRQVSEMENLELMNLLSSDYVQYTGSIVSSSRNSSVESWAKRHLQLPTGASTLLHAYLNTTIQKELGERLQDEIVLQMTQRSIAPLIRDKEYKDWFLEVVENLITLWEVDI